MDSQWQTSHTPITADEADRLVELVLRQRLSGSELIPVDTKGLTLHSIAQAVGARDEEVAMLLCDLRGQKGKIPTRKAIPVKRSLALIAAIYGGVFFLAVGMYLLGGSVHPRTVIFTRGPDGMLRPLNSVPTMYHVRGVGDQLPRAVGFTYRQESRPGIPTMSNETIDWTKAEQGLIDAVNDLNSSEAVVLKGDVSQADIASEIARGDSLPADSINGLPDQYGNAPQLEGRLVRWEPFELTVNDHTIRTVLPSAKVADEALEKAVRANIKDRIAKIIKAMRVRMAASEPTTELR